MKQDFIAAQHNTEDESSSGSDDAIRRSAQTRRRALLAAGAIGLLLAFLWLGDVLSGIVPHKPYHPATQHAGPYAVTLTVNPSQPSINGPIHLRLQIADAAHQPVRNAAVTFQWNMEAMDMGTTSGHATPDAMPGAYDVTVASAMSGYWRLSVTIQPIQQATGSTSFDIPVQS
jgi:hypothetical protein